VSQYQKGKTSLVFTEAIDSERQWHQLGHMQVCTSLQTDNHASTPPLSLLQAGCPSCHPTNSVKALKATDTCPLKLTIVDICPPHLPMHVCGLERSRCCVQVLTLLITGQSSESSQVVDTSSVSSASVTNDIADTDSVMTVMSSLRDTTLVLHDARVAPPGGRTTTTAAFDYCNSVTLAARTASLLATFMIC